MKHFLLIYSKSAESKMGSEIQVTTIATGSLSFGLENRWVFSGLSFFEDVKKSLG